MTGPILKALSAREMELGAYDSADRGADSERWRHWHLSRDDNNLAWLIFDREDASANTLSEAVLEELSDIIDTVTEDRPAALVIRSAKSSGFCMGADIREFATIESEGEVAQKLARGHDVVHRLEALSFPTVAVIHGPCLGGGLELALCCDHRLAVRGASFGFPEVQLGLHPGLGGTARLTQRIDPLEAMTMMLTGKTISDRKARELGLVDELLDERHVATAVREAAAGRIKGNSSGVRERLLTTMPARQFEGRQMRAQAARKARPDHYPAPNALIKLWEDFGGDVKAMSKAEITSFSKLLVTETSRNLVRVFFLREKLKDLARADAEPVSHVHVIGAGEMGADIAGWCAFQGLRTSLFDVEADKVARAVGKLSDLCRRRQRSEAETRDIRDRLIPDLANQGVEHADLVIEAVPENVGIKHKVYGEIEPRLQEHAILATNTSSIPLESLGEGLRDPGRLVGLHFFNPVPSMPLVEVVRQDASATAALERARAFVGQIDKLAAPVATAPGFLVNRALTPYLVEALLMLDEGVRAETIDKVAEDFGMPMGPIELADQVGLDICLSVADMLRERLDEPLPEPPQWLRRKVGDGKLGRKSGSGLYDWEGNKPQKKNRTRRPPANARDRLLLPMLNACMACLREGVIGDEDTADGAMIFGTGFAPFRGGPMHYARKLGFDEVHKRLQELASEYGARFDPHPGWKQV